MSTDTFQKLLDAARNDQDLLDAARNDERQEAVDRLESQGAVPDISDRAIDLIVVFEVSSKAVYERRYRHPIWPKGRSGITCGIGYDVGYVTPPALKVDWQGNTSDTNIARLGAACGVTGQKAEALVAQMREVDIPFDNAMSVFRSVTLVHTTAKTMSFLPNARMLSPDSLGALVSLVYNRGASFNGIGDRYLEMRQIRDDIADQHFSRIPARFRSMKRLWQNDPASRGLVTRRELEAVLFEEGLTQ